MALTHAFNSSLDGAEIAEILEDTVPALAGRIVSVRKHTPTTGEIVLIDDWAGSETTDATNAITAATATISYQSGGRFKTGLTANATPVTAGFLKLPANGMSAVTAIVMARSGANFKRFKIEGTFTRANGNSSILGTNVINSWGAPSWAATLVAAGQGVAVQLTGANSTNIMWAGKISYEAAVL